MMRGGNRKLKRRNRIYRRIAIALTVALLAGQSHAFVLAEETTEDVPQTEVSSEEIGEDIPADGSADGGDTAQGDENSAADQDTGDDNTPADQEPGDNGNLDNDQNTENNPSDGGGEENTDGDADGQGQCICETACTEEAVNAECPVCAADYTACAGEADDGENDDTENNDLEGDGENNDGIVDGQGQCICETACTEEAVNAECPVCAADYTVCAGKEAEEILENVLDAEAGIAALADEGLERTINAFVIGRFSYRVKYGNQVELAGTASVGMDQHNMSGRVVIPETVEKDGNIYRVTSICDNAFYGYSQITSVEIPDSVTSIGKSVFFRCPKLRSVKLSNHLTSIGNSAFEYCSNLSYIDIPNTVINIGNFAFANCDSLSSVVIPNSMSNINYGVFAACDILSNVEIPNSVTSIGNRAFEGCSSLKDIKIPDSVTNIGYQVFWGCNVLENIEIPDGVTQIEDGLFLECTKLEWAKIPNSVTSIGIHGGTGEWPAFGKCENLKELRLVVSVNEEVNPPTVAADTFERCPTERFLVFLSEDGSELTASELENARRAYLEAGENDDDPNDGKWYGWSVGKVSETVNTYRVTINVKKDGSGWIGHGRTFALTKDGGTSFVTNLDAVEAGTYTIYDVTGLTADEFQTKGLNTGESVTVTDVDVSAEVAYCTVTFYDYDAATGETAYGEATDQRPQIVLRNTGRVVRPASDPSKAGHTFVKWVTAPEGDTEFVFASTPVTAPTKIYARWTENTVPALTYKVTIHVKKDDSDWDSHGRTFALLKDGGDFLTVPGQPAGSTYEISQVPDGAYSIYDTTGVQAGARYSRARDTGMDVRVSGADTEVNITVNGADAEETVNYYTVTFYDGADAYGAGTPQQPQTVLRGQKAARPEDPEKAGWQFAGWKTEAGGSISYKFNDAVTGITDIYASWVKKTAEQLHITATAAEGGTIAPEGSIAVAKGGEQTFTITPDEGYRIKAVTVDGTDVTEGLGDTPARAQAGAKYYTFTNVTDNHVIHAAFERDGSTPGGGDNPNPGGGDNPNPGGDNPNPGGGDNPNPGGEGGTGDNTKPGGGGGTGDNTKPGGGSGTGDNTKPGGGSGTGDSHASGGDSAEKGQEASGTETASIQAGSGAAGTFADANAASEGGTAGASGSANGPASGSTTADDSAVSALVQASAGKEPAADGSEPKTGDTAHMEVYATIAMIAGLTYLILYFMEEGRGMTEREKDVFVAAFIRWGKKGGAFRKCCAMLAIFCLLAYYHAIGKRMDKNVIFKIASERC